MLESLMKNLNKDQSFRFFIYDIKKEAEENIVSNYSLWPNNVFICAYRYSELILKHFKKTQTNVELFSIIYPLVIWNFSKSKYIFDQEIFDQLINSEHETIPIDVFQHLKDWSTYIDLRGNNFYFQNKKWDGVCLSLIEYARKILKTKFVFGLVIVFFCKDGYVPFVVPCVSNKIEECIDFLLETAPKNFDHDYEPYKISVIKKILNLFCYIQCANVSIFNENNKKYKYEDAKKESHIFIPRDVKTWRVKNTQSSPTVRIDNERIGAAVKPHVRRGHFHSFYVGPKDNPTDIVVKWIPPIYVNSNKIKGVTI